MLLNMGAILLSAGVGILAFAGRMPDEANRRTALTAGPLLTFFGSPERVKAASLEELEAVPGLPGKVARRIHEQLHRLGGTPIEPTDGGR